MLGGRRFLCVAAVAAGGLTLVPGASASGQWAFVWADQPSAAAYAPDAAFQGSSAGATNTVERTGVGAYVVHLNGLSGQGGAVDVTASEHNFAAICWDTDRQADGFGISLAVRCADAAGDAVDTRFYAAYTRVRRTTGRFAYTAGFGDFPQPPIFTYSTGGKVTVQHIGVGLYQIDLKGLANKGGTATATAAGSTAGTCGPVSWHTQGAAERAFVACTTATGTLTDALPFSFTFADHQTLLGDKGLPSAYAWASKATKPAYTGDAAHSFSSAGPRPQITRDAVGQYRVVFPKLGGVANAHVRATGGPGPTCQVAALDSSTRTFAQVFCYTAAGTFHDTTFVLQLVGRPLP